MKKILSVVAVMLTLFFIACSVPVCAASAPKIYVTNAAVIPGKTFTVDVKIANNPGINSFRFGFDYDQSILTLDKVELSPEFSGQFIYVKKAVWLASANVCTDGTVLTLTFTAAKDIESCDTSVKVTFSDGDICNFQEQIVRIDSESGIISVVNAVSGDLNNDGKINIADINLMLRSVLGMIDDKDIVYQLSDLNDDGKVNVGDVQILKLKILGN